MNPSTRRKLVDLVQQILGSMAIGIVLFVVAREIARYSLSAESLDRIDSPIVMNILALIAFPFVRKFMTTSDDSSE